MAERILTTHAGSLPKSDMVCDLVAAGETGAPVSGDQMVDPEVAFANLENLVEGARRATRRLWGR